MPQADLDPQRQLALLLEFTDMLRISLAGNLKDFELVNAAESRSGVTRSCMGHTPQPMQNTPGRP